MSSTSERLAPPETEMLEVDATDTPAAREATPAPPGPREPAGTGDAAVPPAPAPPREFGRRRPSKQKQTTGRSFAGPAGDTSAPVGAEPPQNTPAAIVSWPAIMAAGAATARTLADITARGCAWLLSATTAALGRSRRLASSLRDRIEAARPVRIEAPPLSPYRAALLALHRHVLDRRDARLERVSTAVETELDGLDVAGPNRAMAHGYRPTPRRLVGWALDCLMTPPDQATFIDIGSGRGRVLFEAARRPFQRIVGIEFAEELHEDASLNLRHWPRAQMRCREVDLVRADALEAKLPDGDLVVWMFDPFDDRLITRMAARLADHARHAAVTVILVEPRNPTVFRESAAFRELDPPVAARRRLAWLSPYPVRIFAAGPQ